MTSRPAWLRPRGPPQISRRFQRTVQAATTPAALLSALRMRRSGTPRSAKIAGLLGMLVLGAVLWGFGAFVLRRTSEEVAGSRGATAA